MNMKMYMLWLTFCFIGALVTGLAGKKRHDKGNHFIFWLTAPAFLLFGVILFWRRRAEFARWWVKELFNA
jgi:predicted branched-subunit amino acid permease